MHHALKHWTARLAPLALGAAMLSILAAPAQAGDQDWRGDGWKGGSADFWYARDDDDDDDDRDHDWHGGKHHDWHAGPHFGPHSRPHWDPLYGWHAGPHFGPHAKRHHDWHKGGHHDWYDD